MSNLSVERLTHVYSVGTPFEKIAISDVNVDISKSEYIGIIGHTGSGKSTFVQHLNALLKPTEGKILLNGEDINGNWKSRREVKFKIGLVFQYPEYQLFEETVYADIAFGPKNMKLSEEEIDARVREAAAFTGIGEELFDESPLELSGGQKRRVAIAGVIAMRPEILVMDEPTAGLDPEGCRQILDNIEAYRKAYNATVMLVSHSMDFMAEVADRLIVFNKGSIAYDGTADEVFCHSSELRNMGLKIPQAAEIVDELAKLGIRLPEGIYTHDELISAILAYKGVEEHA